MITDILLEAIDGDFDVNGVAAHLESQPFTVRDKIRPEMFMIGTDEDDVETAVEARAQDPKRFPTRLILVELAPKTIGISYRSSRTEPARRFVEWLRSQYPVKVMDDEYNDLTEQCAQSLDVLFGTASSTS